MSGVHLKRDGDVALLNLGSPDERVVIFTQERMLSLSQAIDELAKLPGLRGVVIAGANPEMFCAGADIRLIQSVRSREQGSALARLGQDIFQKLADLPLTKVAAISGPAVGGGYELVLACDIRIAADTPPTKVGLPEVKIGIIPGFGGTQRLPMLVGLTRATDLILKGKVLPARVARKLGMVDEVLTAAAGEDVQALWLRLLKTACELANKPYRAPVRKQTFIDRLCDLAPPVKSIVKRRILTAVKRESRGFYPAPSRAVDCLFGAGYHGEQEAIGDLVISPECKSLVNIFLISEESQKLGKGSKSVFAGKRIGVIGGGVMGAGIAASFLQNSFPVTVLEPVAQTREKALAHARESLAKKRSLREEDQKRALDSLIITEDQNRLHECSVVIEAIVEDLAIKQRLLGSLPIPSSTLVATNTSSLSVTQIAEGISAPERMFGLHFFNPVEKMPLVEVIRGAKSSDATALLGAGIAVALGKYPVVVEDRPGFLVNRILTPYLQEASRLLEEGHSVYEIDGAAAEFGLPMGPLRLLDEIGLDVAAKVSKVLGAAYGARMEGQRFEGKTQAEKMIELGKLGKKNGAGFYLYDTGGSTPDPLLHSKLGIVAKAPHKPRAEIMERLLLLMVNEAIRALDEGVAGAPGPEAASQIDLASVMGLGFPPFRGGILYYAESMGAGPLLAKLKHFEKELGPRFAPAAGVVNRAEKGLSFRSRQ